jgi:hypothetical protein
MPRPLTVLALLAAGALAAPPAAGAQSANQLRAQVTALKQSRDTWKRRALERADEIKALNIEVTDAYEAIERDLAAQVRVIAARGRVTEIHRFVFEPIRTAWPCGATLYQGTSLWSLDVSLSDTDYSGDEVARKDCSG